MLYARVALDDEALRSALQRIDSAYKSYLLDYLITSIRHAVRICAQSRPQLLEQLRQRIAVACAINEVPADSVAREIGFTPKNAAFWRMVARGDARQGSGAINALYWERFLAHASHEGLFSASSEEAAVVWLQIAATLADYSPAELHELREDVDQRALIDVYYNDQPPEITALRPEPDELIERVFQPGFGFKEAAKIQPHEQTFAMWWAWADRLNLTDKLKEDIALQWSRSRPRDVKPLVYLSQMAEGRNALSLAIKRLNEAEAIDPLNQDVREARVRITLSTAWRHFADRKPHLVEKDLGDLAALPSMAEGDRAAVLESLRGAWHALRGDKKAEADCLQSVTQRAGPLVGPVLFEIH